MKKSLVRLLAIALALGLVAAACADDDAGTDAGVDSPQATHEGPGATGTEGGVAGVLAGVCPDPVIIQTDWHAESEYGATYGLLGDDYVVDDAAAAVTGSLTAGGTDTGVDIEIREGGPVVGFSQASALMYLDPDVLLGFVGTSEAVENSLSQPTIAVIAPLEKNPQVLMWNPEKFPGVEKVEDMPEGTLVVGFGPATYLDWMVNEGLITEDQIDGSYDAGPTRFAADDGGYMQQGFASAEPYIYEHEVPEYAKAVQYELIHDMGFQIYSQAIAVRAEALEPNRACLELLVPIIQQSAVDYLTTPGPVNDKIIDITDTFDDGWVYTAGVAAFSGAEQARLGLTGNGPDETIGNFDIDRVAEVIEQTVPVYENLNIDLVEGLTPEDIVTNEFIDESIGL